MEELIQLSSSNIANSSYNNRSYVDGIITQDSKNKLILEEEQITFINYTRNYSVCFVDIVESTKTTCKIIESDKIRQYYSVFLNTMASIIKRNNGRTIKNSGDSLLYYFPRTIDANNEGAFEDVIKCGLTMIKENEKLNEYYNSNFLPSINYRISANYGRVELAVSFNSNNVDLFGSSVNECSKINQIANPNQMIIHGDLYKVLSKMTFYDQYIFRDMSKDPNEKNHEQSVVYSVDKVVDQDIDNSKIANIKQAQHKLSSTGIKIQEEEKSSYNILLIDDDKDILFTFRAIFENQGYKVDSFSNPLEALNHFACVDPYYYDLIIMDIRMPELNGIKLYSKIKILNPDVKIFFLSALNALDEVLSIFPEIKYSEIIRKPVEPATLLSKVETIVRA
jgi:CheY-like chemotaxis protein/class 3 adenylate cyclase